jgi:hypothetical protein
MTDKGSYTEDDGWEFDAEAHENMTDHIQRMFGEIVEQQARFTDMLIMNPDVAHRFQPAIEKRNTIMGFPVIVSDIVGHDEVLMLPLPEIEVSPPKIECGPKGQYKFTTMARWSVPQPEQAPGYWFNIDSMIDDTREILRSIFKYATWKKQVILALALIVLTVLIALIAG